MPRPRPCPKGEEDSFGSGWPRTRGVTKSKRGEEAPRPRPRPSPEPEEEVEKGIRFCLVALDRLTEYGSFLPIEELPLILAFGKLRKTDLWGLTVFQCALRVFFF